MPAPTSVSLRSRNVHAVDADGAPLGRIVDVWRSRDSGLAWGVLRSGVLRRRRLVPLRDAEYGPGRVRLAHAGAVLRAAPVLGPGRGGSTPADEERLRRHYGV
jgi:hypothetical protein